MVWLHFVLSWTLKCEVHIIFTSNKIVFFFPGAFKNVKIILSLGKEVGGGGTKTRGEGEFCSVGSSLLLPCDRVWRGNLKGLMSQILLVTKSVMANL